MRLTFCAACGAIEDLHHHHLVTRSEGRKRFDDERNLTTLCYPCHPLLHERQLNGVYSASERVKAGQAAAGRRGGQPSLTATKPDVTARIAQLRTDEPIRLRVRSSGRAASRNPEAASPPARSRRPGQPALAATQGHHGGSLGPMEIAMRAAT
jgi:hypothetical protein